MLIAKKIAILGQCSVTFPYLTNATFPFTPNLRHEWIIRNSINLLEHFLFYFWQQSAGFLIQLFFSTSCLHFCFFILFCRKIKLHKKPCLLPRETPLASVSIMKPLMGADPNLLQNLETFFTMQYPTVSTRFRA